MKTLLLDQSAWDLVIDSAGNIAVGHSPYALAQDVASAIRLFKSELWYNQNDGIPYFETVLGHLPPVSLLAQYVEEAALSVPEVVSAQLIITSFKDRNVQGQVQFIDESGIANAVKF